MPIGGGKSFLDKTWAQTFDETRFKNATSGTPDTTPVSIPYGKQILEITASGGAATAPIIKAAYTTQKAAYTYTNCN